jgi:hypothetical protein
LRPRARFALLAALFISAAVVISQYPPGRVFAAPTGSANPSTVINPTNTTTITVNALETGAAGPIVVQVGTGSDGQLLISDCVVAVSDDCGLAFTQDSASKITVTNADNGGGASDQAVKLTFVWLPPSVSAPTTFKVFACQEGCPTLTEITSVTVNPPNAAIFVTATPNVLTCSGGTSDITAEARNAAGNVVSGIDFHFSTDFGLLEQTDNDTATLTLPAGRANSATVTAEAVGFPDGTVLIQVRCFVSVVVTANPNVITCGGSTLITASARDDLGHPIPGLGYHFVTNQGLLTVQPYNVAANESAAAVLQLYPGMDSAVVVVSVGADLGTIEKDDGKLNDGSIQNQPNTAAGVAQGYVTVQQFCPTQSTPGSVKLTVPATTIACGTSTFVGAIARDDQGGVVPDGTEINFTASAGFIGKTGSTPPSSPTGPSSVTVNVKGGAANVLFVAPQGSGTVRITAAGGAYFGTVDLQVNCGVTAPSTGTGTGGTPICIGDNVCILPPNTGNAGLKRG